MYASVLPIVIRRGFTAVGYLGVGFYLTNIQISRKWIKVVIGILAIGVLVLGIFLNGGGGIVGMAFEGSTILYFCISSFVCSSLMLLLKDITYSFPVISFFGRESMTVYCTHMLIIEGIWIINNKFLGWTWLEGLFLAVLALVLDLPLIFILKKWFPKLIGIWNKKKQS